MVQEFKEIVDEKIRIKRTMIKFRKSKYILINRTRKEYLAYYKD